jgi:hypothetical protein
VQGLYVYEAPETHTAGLSVKADLGVGLVTEAAYRYTHGVTAGIDGLAVSAGVDYSIGFDTSSLYFVAEYLYAGASSSSALTLPLPHNIYGLLQYSYSALGSISASCLVSFDTEDALAITPALAWNQELMQGVSLQTTLQCFAGKDSVTGFALTGLLRVRF